MTDPAHPAVRALAAVLADAAGLLRLDPADLRLELMEARDWPDTCLGLGGPDDACGDAITPGYLVILADGLVYRTDATGSAVRRDTSTIDRELVVHFRQTGGIGGWSSEYYADDGSLAPEEADHLRRFIDEAGYFDLPAEVGNGAPIFDGYRYTLFLAHGRRSHTVRTYDGGGPPESPALDALIGWLKARAPEPHPHPVTGDAARRLAST